MWVRGVDFLPLSLFEGNKLKPVILADFSTNCELTNLAKKTLDRLNGISVGHTCVKATDHDILNSADVVIQFLDKEKLIRIPNKVNVAVGTHDKLGQFAHIVDHLWDDYPTLVNVNDNTVNITHLAGEYTFYTINSDYDKSNTRMIIQAFAEEFDPAEPVNLVIKTNRLIDKEMVEIKTAVGRFKNIDVYKKHVVISKNHTDDELCSLHNSFDCYIESEDNDKAFEYVKILDKPVIVEFSAHKMASSMREYYANRTKCDNLYYKPVDINNYFFEKLGELNGET